MKLLIIAGGKGLSSEYEISHKSAEGFLAMLQEQGLSSDLFFVDERNYTKVSKAAHGYDLVIPLVHGHFGEDGTLQSLLETEEINFLGSGSQASSICFDKAAFKDHLKDEGIPLASGSVIRSKEDIAGIVTPSFIKPTQNGSSIGTHQLLNHGVVEQRQIEQLLKKYGPLLAEELLEGVEITVPVMGDKALPVIEIIPPQGESFDFNNKYSGATREIVGCINLSTEEQRSAQELALKVHQLCNCRDYSRTDMILTPKGLYVLELNTSPGMTLESLYPKALRAEGHSIIDLLEPALFRERTAQVL